MTITADDLDRLLIECREDRRVFIPEFLWIKTKDRQVIPLQLNEAQLKLINAVEKQERAAKPVRGIIVKPRQVGFTTVIQALFWHASSLFYNTNALTVAHDLDASQEIFGMSRLFLDKLPSFLRPLTRFSNRKEIVFENGDTDTRQSEPGLRSQLRVATANDPELGRSKTIHLLHRSERAFWQNQEETLLSVSQAVPNMPGTMIFDESTPNGVGDQFHRDYKAAKEGITDFFPFFMAWFEHSEYQKEIEGPRRAFEDALDDEERGLQQAYSLTLEQLCWRRWAIYNTCGGDAEKFKQEYPSNDVECFLLSGRGRFDGKLLQSLLTRAVDPITRGDLRPDGSRVRFEENEKGALKIWKMPRLNGSYVIGADPATGKAKTAGNRQGDFSCADVTDRETLETVAEWHGHIEAGPFGDELEMVGKMYNFAKIGVEWNMGGHGGTVCYRLQQLSYPDLYYRQELDTRTGRRRPLLGWQTNTKTKPQMIDGLALALIDGLECPNREFIEECMTYVYDDDGSTNAQEGCFDDRVTAKAISLEVNKISGIERIFPFMGKRKQQEGATA